MTTTEPTDSPTDTPATPATDIATTEDVAVAAFFDHAASLVPEDDEAMQERILRNLLTATTVDDILRSGEATPASAIYGVPIRVHSIRASESDFSDGPERYLHVDVETLGNGDRLTVSCGARDVVMKLIRLDQLHMLPVTVRIEQSKKATKGGYFPVFLRPVDSNEEPF